MEEEKDSLTLGDIFRTIFSQKWLALIITIVITLGVSLGLHFGYNPNVTEYVSKYTVIFPGSENVNPKFPDNSPFKYIDIISLDNLNSAKASDEERFGYLEIGTMYANNDISIAHPTNSLSEQEERYYTIRVSAKYFKNRSDATDFIYELTQMPVKTLLKIADARDNDLSDYNDSKFYEDKIDILTAQVEYLINGTTDLVNKTNLSENTHLLNKLKRYDMELKTAVGEMRQNLYVHDVDEVRAVYNNLLFVVDSDIARKTREIELIFGRLKENDSTVDYIQTSETIEKLAAEISELEERRALYSSYLNGKDGKNMNKSDEFYNKLVSLGEELETLTSNYADNLREYYIKYSFITNDGAIETAGGLNIIVSGLIGLITGIIVAAVVAYIVGRKRLLKAASNPASAQAEPPANNSSQEN